LGLERNACRIGQAWPRRLVMVMMLFGHMG
jgi:hypothetical protein